MAGLTAQEILSKLGPRSGTNLLYDILLYILFFMNVIIMFMQSDKQLVPTIFAGLAAALAVVAKLDVLAPKAFGSLVVNAGIFVLPLIVAGITRAKKSVPLAVIDGLLAGVYFFAFWFFNQRS
jgi:hypothetical protein